MTNKNDEKYKIRNNLIIDSEMEDNTWDINSDELQKFINLVNIRLNELKEYQDEVSRISNVTTNLHDDIRGYDQKIKKQAMIINIQWDIIACLMELKGVIEE